jgi:hypothetical protein
MFIVDRTHESSSGREDLVDEDENGLFRCELDTLPYDIDELADCEVLSMIEQIIKR